jgi:epoxyqueuosine reductase
MDQHALARDIKNEARAAGFDLCGIASSARFEPEGRALTNWVELGYHGEMDYMARNAPRSADPKTVVTEARALVVVGLYYGGHGDGADADDAPASEGAGEPRGRISRYAWGDDYHSVMAPRLRRLAEYLVQHGARTARYYVDTGPVIDRAAARRAGIGWFGKNTLIITRSGHGSWVFLGEILTDLPLPPDGAAEGDCGRCRLCLDACPTGAIIAPYVVDARRCISYLTIEHRGPIPRELRPAIGDHIFGCDICQVVCPHNTKTAAAAHDAFAPRRGVGARPSLLPLLNMTEDEYRNWFSGSPLKRAKRSGLRRNVAVALGNLGDLSALPDLCMALEDESDALVRGHAAWALGRLATETARLRLQERLAGERDPWVREEISLALAAIAPGAEPPA